MSAARKPVNLSIDPELLVKARELDVNISRAAEDGLRAAVSRAWQIENADAIAAWNVWVEENGLPLTDLRLF